MIGCGEQDIIMNAQIAGQPIKAIATMFQNSPLGGLMSMPNSQIYDLQDLMETGSDEGGKVTRLCKWLMVIITSPPMPLKLS